MASVGELVVKIKPELEFEPESLQQLAEALAPYIDRELQQRAQRGLTVWPRYL